VYWSNLSPFASKKCSLRFKLSSDFRAKADREIIKADADRQAEIQKKRDEETKKAQEQQQKIVDANKKRLEEIRKAEEAEAARKAEIDKRVNEQLATNLQNEIDTTVQKEIEKEAILKSLREKTAEEKLEEEYTNAQNVLIAANASQKELSDLFNHYENKRQEIRDAADADAEKKAEEQKVRDEAVAANRLAVAANTANLIAQLAGEGSAIAKGVAVAQATIDTYKGAVSAYGALAPIPIVGPALGGIAAAAAIASGLKAVKQITATKSPEVKQPNYASGVIGLRGSGSGTSDNVSANLSAGESVINARSTSMFANELAAINQAGGGVGLNGASNVLNQNEITNGANNSQLVSMIAEAVAIGAEAGTSKGSEKGITGLSDNRRVMSDAKF